ncbi:MAG TPA: hypothetical protein VM686_20185 [Polyangiaceae bacterium]|nr:hypothetical protein [Polyangiaceae bacterium]
MILSCVACGESDDADPPAEKGSMGTTGGFVGDEDGLGVYIPPGALAEPTVITLSIAESGESPATPAGAIGSVYSFEPHDLTLAVPVTLHLPLPDGDVAGAFGAAPGGDWELLETDVQLHGSTASFESVTFGYFVLSN